jgi:phage head maturation protease
MSTPAKNEFPSALPLQTRAAPIEAVDAEARVVEVIFTTGASVRRRRYVGWDSAIPFDEVLTVSREAVDLSRLNAGAPALDSHSTYTTYAQVGVVENARIEGKQGLAQIRFPSKGVDEAADRMFAMVSEKIIRNISVGYIINEMRVIEPEKKGQVEQRIATRWTPYEVSFVTVPADAGAQTRAAADLATYPLVVSRQAMLADDLAAVAARMRMRQLQI